MKQKPLPKLPRTLKQNKALHLYFRQIADDLNASGLDIRAVIKPGIEILWNEQMVKDYLWRPIQKVYLKKASTTELDRYGEIEQVYEIMNRHLAKFGIHEPFPNKKDALDKSLEMAPAKTLEEEVEKLKEREKKLHLNKSPLGLDPDYVPPWRKPIAVEKLKLSSKA